MSSSAFAFACTSRNQAHTTTEGHADAQAATDTTSISDDASVECVIDDDCDPGERCFSGTCRTTYTGPDGSMPYYGCSMYGCDPGELCVNNECRIVPEAVPCDTPTSPVPIALESGADALDLTFVDLDGDGDDELVVVAADVFRVYDTPQSGTAVASDHSGFALPGAVDAGPVASDGTNAVVTVSVDVAEGRPLTWRSQPSDPLSLELDESAPASHHPLQAATTVVVADDDGAPSALLVATDRAAGGVDSDSWQYTGMEPQAFGRAWMPEGDTPAFVFGTQHGEIYVGRNDEPWLLESRTDVSVPMFSSLVRGVVLRGRQDTGSVIDVVLRLDILRRVPAGETMLAPLVAGGAEGSSWASGPFTLPDAIHDGVGADLDGDGVDEGVLIRDGAGLFIVHDVARAPYLPSCVEAIPTMNSLTSIAAGRFQLGGPSVVAGVDESGNVILLM